MKFSKSMMTALAIGAIFGLAGCGGSKATKDKSREVTFGEDNSNPRDPKSQILEPTTSVWKYEQTPSPAPSKTPRNRLNEVTFEMDSSTAPREATGVMRETAKEMLAQPAMRLYLLGFAYKTENPTIAMTRANAVKETLVGYGVPADRLETGSFGNMFSQADKTEPMQMKLDRRVEMWILPQ